MLFTFTTETDNRTPPYIIPFVLDPESGKRLPRQGTQTGRFAFMDLIAESYWPGMVTGDKVTIEWDRQCACGRKGAYVHDSVIRYSDEVTGDDKVLYPQETLLLNCPPDGEACDIFFATIR